MVDHIVGDPSIFAIEWNITEAYSRISQLALGFFIIHVRGRFFGVRSPKATLMGCSFDQVEERILQRGTHSVSFSQEAAAEIVEAFRAAIYDDIGSDAIFFGMKVDEFRENLFFHKIQWAPDGDEAFDDGSHVLQFDHGGMVRLIAFKNLTDIKEIANSITEVWVDGDQFYQILGDWLNAFETERTNILKSYGDSGLNRTIV